MEIKTPYINVAALILFAGLAASVHAQTGAGTALLFNGTSSYVDTTNGAILGTNFTEEAWIYSTASDGVFHAIMGNDGGTGLIQQRCPSLYLYNTALHGGFGDGVNWDSWITSNGVVQPNAWNHVAQTYDGSTFHIYVNGNLVLASNIIGVPFSQPVRYIGRLANFFKGQIDEVRIWNVAHSQAQIQSNMNFSLVLPQTNLVAYFRFNEGSGTNTSDLALGRTGLLYATTWTNSTAPISIPITATTMAASNITSSTALLNGSVNPKGAPTTAWFEWGTTTAYGSSTATVNLGASNVALNITLGLTGLTGIELITTGWSRPIPPAGSMAATPP